jgi:Flp pilus assembly protein protease CpaA
MTVGASLFTIAVGAILAFAVDAEVAGIEIETVGVILLVVGVVGLVLGLVLYSGRRRGVPPA